MSFIGGNAIRQSARRCKAESSWMAIAKRTNVQVDRSARIHTSAILHNNEPKHVHKHEYVPLSRSHKFALTLGSLFASLFNPARGDMIALLSELSGEPLLPKLREMMLRSTEGRSLMMQRPAINTQSVDMSYLESLPENTFGKQYFNWLKWCNVGPDTRAKVRFIQDPELAYVMQRYRECHDFYHLMCSMPVNHLGETVVKIFEAAHMGLPVAFLSSIAGPLRLTNEERSSLMGSNGLANWAWKMGKRSKPLIGVRWEDHWETDMNQLRSSLGFDEPPPIKVDFNTGKKTSARTSLARGRWPSKMMETIS